MNNTAVGLQALSNNTTGSSNTAAGLNALISNTTGSQNTALGQQALNANTTGQRNIGLGFQAGLNLSTGSNNIDIANAGVAAESNTIRIGTQGTQTKAFIAGISSTLVSGSAVTVSSTGQLGIVLSSARYKREIGDMGPASDKLMELRPVTFRYKQDPQGERQYGLIAEEVARVYPELVSHDTDGEVISVRYHELIPMLLNQVQKQARQIERQREQDAAQIRRLSAQVAELKGMLEQVMAAQKGTHIAAAFNRD